MVKKIINRMWSIVLSIPNILLALIFEYKLHPWKYIFDSISLPSNIRVAKIDNYIKRYFSITSSNGDYILERNGFKISIPIDMFNNKTALLGFFIVFIDIIYPNQVKYPIPLIIVEGNYEKYGAVLEVGDTVIDAGANIGVFSVYASNIIGNSGSVLAFEPIPEICDILGVQNKYIQNKNIQNIQAGLGDTVRKTSFRHSDEHFGGSSESPQDGVVDVNINTIDNYVINSNIRSIDFIKMDIEGAERHALVGATDTIKKFKPKLSICIYHRFDDPETIRDIILNIRPDYKYMMSRYKIYAW